MTTKQERQGAIERLRGWLKPGDTVHCVLRHVSRSGMQRRISFYKIDGQVELLLDRSIALALGMGQRDRLEGVLVGGCGMDMGFAVVSHLSAALFPDGFGCIGDGGEHGPRCPSNDHSNGDRDYTPHTAGEAIRRDVLAAPLMAGSAGFTFPFKEGATVHWHKSGDYALRHRWL